MLASIVRCMPRRIIYTANRIPPPDTVELFRALVADFENVAMLDVARTRTQIKKLVGETVSLDPTKEGHLKLIKESPGSKRTEACELRLVAGQDLFKARQILNSERPFEPSDRVRFLTNYVRSTSMS